MKLSTFKNFIAIFIFLIGSIAHAEFTWDTGAFYYSDGFKYSTDSKYAVTFWNTSLNWGIGKSKQFFAGWHIMGLNQSQEVTAGVESKYATMEMGPRFMYANKKGTAQIAVSYHLRNTTTYDAGDGTPATLKGSSIFAEISYMPEWNDSFRAGFKLNYYAASFNESLVNDTDYSQVSYNRTMIFPSLAFSLRW